MTFQARSSGKSCARIGHHLLDAAERRERVGAGRLIDRDQRRRRAVQPRRAVEIGGAQFQPRDVAEAQHRPVRVGADDDLLELGGRGQPPLGLDVELQLLIVGNRPRADPADRGLHVLRLGSR